MRKSEKQIAKYLLQSKAIKLNPAKPFHWASGWKSPIYCDNRKTLSYPLIRSYIKNEFVKLILEKFNKVDVIAGVATGAIAQGALVADAINLPFLYVRSSQKKHGLENLVEGNPEPGHKIVVVEDLISTGGSSLNAVMALRKLDCEVLGMVAIFTYGFRMAEENFKTANCPIYTLSNYEVLLDLAIETGYIKQDQLEILKNWKQDPQNWNY